MDCCGNCINWIDDNGAVGECFRGPAISPRRKTAWYHRCGRYVPLVLDPQPQTWSTPEAEPCTSH